MDSAVFDDIETPITGILSEQIPAIWPKVEPLLERVVKPETGYAMRHVMADLIARRTQLWVVGDFKAVIITSIRIRPLEKVLWVQFMAGSGMREWLSDWKVVQEAYAKQNNCSAIEFAGRKGWKKIYQDYLDYPPVLITFRKTL